MKDQSGAKKYSRTIQLSRAGSETLSLISVINPFNYSLEFDIAAQTETKIQAELLDLFGKVVIKNNYTVRTGINALSLPNTDILPSGTYILRIRSNEIFINRKVVKNAL
ncbi:MAG: T9SS type A sorting domain-containing protein [Bacteroidota bacterium]